MNKGYKVFAKAESDEAEINMYGDVVESRPINGWTGQPKEGNYIVKDEFLADLDNLKSKKKVTIHIDSFGGDASASLTIHNKLRELSENGTVLVAVIDGVAMSAATHIACACDTVKIPPMSLFMVHKCWSFMLGGYNADELREAAKTNDAWDEMQVEIYKKKTGLSDTVIKHMMSDTTYMTGREAVEKGFCDELIEGDVKIAASADRKSIIANGRTIHLAQGVLAPESLPVVTISDESVINQSVSDTDSKEGDKPMAKNLIELREENPELAAQIEAEIRASVSAENTEAGNQAVVAERTRLAEIDEVAHLFDSETVHEAKYGEKPCSAAEMTYRAAQKAAKAGKAFMADVRADNTESKANDVGTCANDENKPSKDKSPDTMAEARTLIRELLKKEEE